MFHLNLSPPVVAVVVLLDFATVSAARLGAKAMILSNLVTLVDKCGADSGSFGVRAVSIFNGQQSSGIQTSDLLNASKDSITFNCWVRYALSMDFVVSIVP